MKKIGENIVIMKNTWKRIDIVTDDNENVYNIYKISDGTFAVTNDTDIEFLVQYCKSEKEAYDVAYNAVKEVDEESIKSETMRCIILHFAVKYGNDWDKIYKALKSKEKVTKEEKKEIVKLTIIDDKFKNAITISDSGYPVEMTMVNKPPFVVWKKEKGEKDE